ncbi:MAG: RDD family protein [Gammaproteobacteria bacterium]|nr:MAG: RDD family protein [Gammaproteobacteria bacterium]
MPESHSEQTSIQNSGFFRRLAAIFYDSLLLFLAVLPLASLPVVMLAGGSDNPFIQSPLFSLYIYCIGFLFFGWFWTHGGQTLGMRSWKVKVIQQNGEALAWKNAVSRYLAATLSWILLGAGFIWILFDKENLALHDRLSKTRLVRYHS